MDKEIIAIIDNYPLWKGDVYRLVALVVAKLKEMETPPAEEPEE